MLLSRTLAAALMLAAAVPAAVQDHPDPLAKLRSATDTARDALVAFIDDQLDSNAIFAGQYAALKDLAIDATPTLQKWIVTPPTQARAEPRRFRGACIAAIRDVVTTASADLTAALIKIADDPIESSDLRGSARFALAQFGDKSRVESVIARATEGTKAADPQMQVRAWGELAEVYYNTRQYGEAANAHVKAIELIEANKLPRQGMPTRLYNAACSMALGGKTDDAIAYVQKALEEGKANGTQLTARLLQTDMDIQSLRQDPRFTKLLADYFGIGKGAAEASDKK